MTQPKHFVPKRRLQILDYETRDGKRCNASEGEKTGRTEPREDPHRDTWVNNFVTRLAALVRSIGDGHGCL